MGWETWNRVMSFDTLTCPECGQVFDMADEEQASEWHYGHDCEDGDRLAPCKLGHFDCATTAGGRCSNDC